jgi:hypothetical protein
MSITAFPKKFLVIYAVDDVLLSAQCRRGICLDLLGQQPVGWLGFLQRRGYATTYLTCALESLVTRNADEFIFSPS